MPAFYMNEGMKMIGHNHPFKPLGIGEFFFCDAQAFFHNLLHQPEKGRLSAHAENSRCAQIVTK